MRRKSERTTDPFQSRETKKFKNNFKKYESKNLFGKRLFEETNNEKKIYNFFISSLISQKHLLNVCQEPELSFLFIQNFRNKNF